MHLLILTLLAFDLSSVRQEPNLEHRSELALDNAASALTACGRLYQSGNLDGTNEEALEIQDSVTLAYESLRNTGKDPRRSPKFFKKAEVMTRQLLRRIDGMIESMSSSDRGILLMVRDRVADIHEDLLDGIMKKKD